MSDRRSSAAVSGDAVAKPLSQRAGAGSSGGGGGKNLATASRGIPDATVARLPVYLRVLTALAEDATGTVSSEELASAAGVNSSKLRKDLSYLGSYGTRGVGYDVDYLVYQISRELGLMQAWPIVIVGVGNLGHALANYGGFASRGFSVAALFDADSSLVGRTAHGLPIQPMEHLERVVGELGTTIGVIATPAPAAQDVCDRLVAAGVHSVLNFAPVVLSVPAEVEVRRVDLSIELQILAFHEQRKSGQGQRRTAPQQQQESGEQPCGGAEPPHLPRRERQPVRAS